MKRGQRTACIIRRPCDVEQIGESPVCKEEYSFGLRSVCTVDTQLTIQNLGASKTILHFREFILLHN